MLSTAQFSSALFPDAAGVIHHGEAAVSRGRYEPERLIRSVVDRIGDDVAIAVGDQRHAAARLYASTARHAVDRITAGEGAAPFAVRLAVPVRWGGHRIGLVRDALAEVGLAHATFASGPVAAVAACEGLDEPDAAVAMYDLSATRLVVTVRRQGVGGVTLAVDGVENLGGGDVDDAILRHVVASARELFADFDSGDPDAVDALSLLRSECVRAKESLASSTEAVVAVRLPSGAMDVVLDRAALDRIAEPTVRATVAVLRRALLSARIDAGELAAIVLIGGSSRLPTVARVLLEEFGRPIRTDDRPETAAARGSALGAVAEGERGIEESDGESGRAPGTDPVDGPLRHPARLARVRRGVAVGSGAIRRRTGAVAAAMAAVVGARSTTDGGQGLESDSPDSAG